MGAASSSGAPSGGAVPGGTGPGVTGPGGAGASCARALVDSLVDDLIAESGELREVLAGLQAMPKEVLEAAKVDGAGGWQSFRHVTFPLMLPVSITVLIIRIIFKLKLADIVINVTAGGPGGATDTVSSFIYRVYRDRSNVGYGTGLAMFYLLMIIVLLTVLLRLSKRWTQGVA